MPVTDTGSVFYGPVYDDCHLLCLRDSDPTDESGRNITFTGLLSRDFMVFYLISAAIGQCGEFIGIFEENPVGAV